MRRSQSVVLTALFIVLLFGAAVVQAAEERFVDITSWETVGTADVVGVWEVALDDDGIQVVLKDREGRSVANLPAFAIQQGTQITYEWTVTFGADFADKAHAGLHFMAERGRPYVSTGGHSYLVVQRPQNIGLLKGLNNTFTAEVAFDGFPAAPNATHTYRVVLNTVTGQIQVYRDGEFVGEWTDPEPLQMGLYVTARVRDSLAVIKDIRMKVEN